MATGFSMWEVDPLFPAAEEVQNSSERMEYIFRSWKLNQGNVQASPGDKSLVAAAATDKRDLVTALDTVRWQLEDFARALKNVAKPEFISSRYSQFVRAIQSQVGNVEKELGELRSKSYARIEEEDSQCLAQFLSGNNNNDNNTSNTRELEAAAAAATENKAEVGEESLEIEESDDSPSTSVSINIVTSECNGHHHHQHHAHHHPRNGFHHPENGESHSKPNGFMNGNGVRRDSEPAISLGSRLASLWGVFRAKTHPLRLQVSNSVLKRWKDGDSGFLGRAEKCLSSLRNGFAEAGDLEQGMSIRKMNGSCSYSPPRVGRLQRAQQSFPSAFQIGVVAVVVIVFMGLYFWFLSTLVPYDHAESFLH